MEYSFPLIDYRIIMGLLVSRFEMELAVFKRILKPEILIYNAIKRV